jgi:hypothetical protein
VGEKGFVDGVDGEAGGGGGDGEMLGTTGKGVKKRAFVNVA